MTGQVTALGIRDGDPAVLNALVDRRGAAVLAYCERACPPEMAAEAAAEAFARFRATVIATPRPADIDPEGVLLAATRHAAAARAPQPAAAGAGPIGRLLGGKAPEQIAEVPALLVARADGSLDPVSEDRLNRLLDASAAARAAEERFHAGEYAYRTAVARPLPPPVKQHVLAAMAALDVAANGAPAVPQPPLAAPPPAPPAPPPLAEEPPQDAAPPPPVEEPPPAPVEEPPVEEPPVEEPPVEEPPAEPAEEPKAEVAEDVPVEEEPIAEEPVAEPPDPEEAPVEDHVVEAEEEAVPDPEATAEWSLPDEELEGDDLEVEIAAARLRPPAGEDDPEHLQSASGAIEEPLVEQAPPEPKRPVLPLQPPAAAPPKSHSTAFPRLPAERPHFPGRSAFAPAAAVVTVAAIGALVASGVFGGDDATPQLDTGIVRPRAVNAIPEGEVDTVVSDLRESAAQARRQRLADQRTTLGGGAPAAEPTEEEPPPAEEPAATTETPAPDAEENEEPAAPADEAEQPSGQADGGDADGTVTGETP